MQYKKQISDMITNQSPNFNNSDVVLTVDRKDRIRKLLKDHLDADRYYVPYMVEAFNQSKTLCELINLTSQLMGINALGMGNELDDFVAMLIILKDYYNSQL
jgi:hypothetical protein